MARKKAYWKTNIQFFLLIVGGIIFIALLLKTFQLIKNSKFDSQNRFTIVLSQKAGDGDILVFSFEPGKKSITAISLPGDTEVLAARNSGLYQIGKVYRLGQLSPEKGGGGRLLAETVRDFLGIGVDGWAVTKSQISNGKSQISTSKILDNLSPQNTLSFLKGGGLVELDTNITIVDIVRLWYEAGRVSLERTETIRLANLDGGAIDKAVATLFSDTKMLEERKTVEIINGTDAAGLGGNIARIVSNMGAQVLLVKTSQEQFLVSKIVFKQASYTTERIAKTFSLPVKVDRTYDGVFDIQIFIGKDYLR